MKDIKDKLQIIRRIKMREMTSLVYFEYEEELIYDYSPDYKLD
ncbi:MAG: hypothetical protein E6902_01040 [Paeniclostridium sordellii]|nr:hypothetical protein [Paeniclostridium hominis]MDU1538178.1 hypothetical protein [Paeniclostridium sordellii]